MSVINHVRYQLCTLCQLPSVSYPLSLTSYSQSGINILYYHFYSYQSYPATSIIFNLVTELSAYMYIV